MISKIFPSYVHIDEVEKLHREIRGLNYDAEKNATEIEKLLNQINEFKSTISRSKEDLQFERNIKDMTTQRMLERIASAKQEISRLVLIIREKDKLYHSLTHRESPNEFIPSLIADYKTLQYNLSAQFLESKKHPAKVEAKRIRELKQTTKEHIEENRILTYKLEYLLHLFPELELYTEDFETLDELKNIQNLDDMESSTDRVRHLLSKEEYSALSEQDRNQLALDRYIESSKSKWQIGRDYELYIGHEYTKHDWEVEYFGIERQLEDMGRDLIASKNGTTHIVQCKYWSQHKLIHEKHITQLYGTTIQYIMENPEKKKVVPVLVTNTQLSETAKRFASFLGVVASQNKAMSDFPRIKCNINQGAKIYHLPIDQQYDNVKIRNQGECFAYTVAEAEKKGFRRAWRWHGSK